jgi:NADPH:quinone reductase-like Zn-dependent oxidoreductase
MAAGLRAGETVLLHGGASGIGTTAIQIAVARGARVLVTAGTPEKVAFCRDLGAEVAINYREQDFVAEVKAATDGRGADVILDVIGAKYLQRNVSSLARGGRLVVIGLQGGLRGELDLGALLAVSGSVTATSLRARPLAEKAKIVAAVRENVWPLIATGAVRPIIDRVLPLEQAAEAHRVLERSDHIGKVLLALG